MISGTADRRDGGLQSRKIHTQSAEPIGITALRLCSKRIQKSRDRSSTPRLFIRKIGPSYWGCP